MKKLVSVLLAVLFLLTALPLGAVSVSASATSGTTGECTWTLNGTHLTISGNGYMSGEYQPWGTEITSVTIENGVKNIGSYAFYGCESLSSVSIPNSVNSIGDSAFDMCFSLTEIYIPVGVNNIGSMAFHWASLTAIHVAAENRSYSSHEGVLYSKDMTRLIIFPSYKSGSYSIPYGVTVIEREAFYDCIGLTALSIPGTVEEIWDSFGLCFDLEEVVLGEGITVVDEYLFSGCESLSSVTLPSTLTTIGYRAFAGCPELCSITFPYSVTRIDGQAFDGCSNLALVYYDGTATDRTAIDMDEDNDALLDADWHYISDGGAKNLKYTVENGEITIIGYTDDLPSDLIIPAMMDGYPVTAIADCAFEYCHQLKSVVIPDSVTVLGVRVFADSSLQSVVIGNGVTRIEKEAFYCCYSLRSLTIGTGITTIAQGAFAGCHGLISVNIPDNVVALEERAFGSCSTLKSVCIGSGLATIGKRNFDDCAALTEVTISADNPYLCVQDGIIFSKDKTTLVLCAIKPAGTYTVPDGVTTIGDGAFDWCCDLTEVVLPDSLITIGDEAFNYCTALSTITFPPHLTTIGEYAFAYCDSLTSVTIPDSVTVMGSSAFAHCNSLTSVTISKSLTRIPRAAFGDCRRLTSVTIPDGVTTIENLAFVWCRALNSITFPDSITAIGNEVFDWCDALTDVYYTGSEEERAAITIGSRNDPLLGAVWHYNHCVHLYTHIYDPDCNTCGAIREVPDLLYGDANSDGHATLSDIGLLQQYLNGWDVTIMDVVCDANGDGKLNNKDLIRLIRYFNGWDVTLGG